MIKANHKRIARILFNPYLKRLLKKNFSGFYLMNSFPKLPVDAALIITPNHFSWWDGFFIDFASRYSIDRDIHILMLEEQLKRFWFFRYLGAYSINENKPKSIIETFQYTSSVLENSSNFVVYYPQGKIQNYDAKPLELREGLRYLIKRSGTNTIIVPAAFKIVYSDNMKPAVFARFGNSIDKGCITESFEHFRDAFMENIRLLDESAGITKPEVKLL